MGEMADKSQPDPRLGQVVYVLRGRDAGQYAVVVGKIDPKFVLLADGYKRKFDTAKKKNIRHVRFQDFVSKEVERSLHEQGRVTNAKLRYALQQFLSTHPRAEEKGE